MESTRRKLNEGYRQIRIRLSRRLSPFGQATEKEKQKRREKGLNGLQDFARLYFPHYLTHPPSPMHEALYATCQTLIEQSQQKGHGGKHAEAAPRGHAKSTLTSLILPLWCIVGCRRRFIGLVSDTTRQAEEFLEFIKAELELNERLREDFPEACGRGKPWRIGQIVSRNGVMVKCWGRLKALRGARHLNRRPDLFICDDLEADARIDSPAQREKDRAWFFRALMKAGNRTTVVLTVGTLLHYDSLLSALLKRPGWSGRTWQAVQHWSTSPLWETWEQLYISQNEAEADRFFRQHQDAMLEGTDVLWPEAEDYLYLMKMRVSDGPAAFDAEKQNQPLHPDDALFREEWFSYVSLDEIQTNLAEVRYQGIFAAVDPSMGKASRKSDPSALLVGGILPDGTMDLVHAEIERRHPDILMHRLFELHETYQFSAVGIEEVQFQELFKDMVEKEGRQRRLYLPVEGLRPNTDKHLRIARLQPHIKNGVFRFQTSQRLLLDQLKYYPKAAHDDGPDALEMLLTLVSRTRGGPRIRSFH